MKPNTRQVKLLKEFSNVLHEAAIDISAIEGEQDERFIKHIAIIGAHIEAMIREGLLSESRIKKFELTAQTESARIVTMLNGHTCKES